MGASFDSVEDNRAFAENEHFPFPLLCDFKREVGPHYAAQRPADDPRPNYARRVTYLIDPEGIVRRAYLVTDIDGHFEAVLKDARSLRE